MIFGSNIILDTGSALTVDDGEYQKELVSWAIGSDGIPIVNAKLDDAEGNVVVGITGSRPFTLQKGHTMDVGPGSFEIKNESTGEVLLEIRHLDENTVKVNGIFYIDGEKLEATDNGVTWKTNTISGNTSENLKKFLTLFKKGGFALG